MSYLDVISLEEAKTYLRIDDTQNETDAEITLMIKSALSFIEKNTNYIFFDRNKTYPIRNGCVRIYDYPINSVESETNYTKEDKGLYTVFSGLSGDSLILNVGYTEKDDIEPELIDTAKILLKFYYYEQEKSDIGVKIPSIVQEAINTNKRFII